MVNFGSKIGKTRSVTSHPFWVLDKNVEKETKKEKKRKSNSWKFVA